jgi:hypothetical protein
MIGFCITKQTFIFLIGLIVLGLTVANQVAAEEQSATLTGRVVNVKGEPLAEAPIVLLYVKVDESGAIDTLDNRARYPFLRQMPARHLPPEFRGETSDETEMRMRPPFLKSETDSEGQFTFTNIAAGMVQLMVLPIENDPAPQNVKPVPEIQTIKFGKVTFHPHDFSFFPPIGAVTFAVKSGSEIKDVEVVIETRPKPKIQGRLIFKNGEPLADTTVKFDIGRLTLEWGGSAFSRSLHTDADGNFVSAISGPGTYALSVNHRGLSAMSEPFTVEADKPHEKVVLTLNGNLTDLSDSLSENSEERRYGLPDVPGVWIVNPENGHAYKWIVCDDWEDAQAKAAGEAAHLVTITSETEQIWLEGVFGPGPYWIGLTDVLKEGEWMWETGEPVTYTNWGEEDEDIDLYEPPVLLKLFIDKDDIQREVKGEEEDYVIMSSRWGEEIGKWHPADPKTAHRRGRIGMAILEKDGMRSKVHGLSLPDITPED